METKLSNQYWDERWQNGETGWDLGMASPAIMQYAESILDKNISILIPGCGNAYEAEALASMGFTNITLIDISATLVAQLKEKYKDLSSINVVLGNFFEHKGQYELILEQTFFCALDPNIRTDYAAKMAELLVAEGRLVGLLFNTTFIKEGPPYGGNTEEYLTYFNPYFEIEKMENCTNSIVPRQGTEVFINLKKK